MSVMDRYACTRCLYSDNQRLSDVGHTHDSDHNSNYDSELVSPIEIVKRFDGFYRGFIQASLCMLPILALHS